MNKPKQFRPFKRTIQRTGLVLLICFSSTVVAQQQNPSRILFQGFWWGSWHDQYPQGYYNYLTRMAPRLREIGIDAIWVFPPQKAGQEETKMENPAGATRTYPKFYESFDNYDLGDKFQKGITPTRGGTKDEYLRMVAVMHANGIDVIQDIVLNHVAMGGPKMLTPFNGAVDPNAPIIDSGQPPQEIDFMRAKNYRYVSFQTPATDESAQDYWSRKGRWHKNWPNFHPNNSHPCPDPNHPFDNADVCGSIFGFNIHDICFYSSAYGASSNAPAVPSEPQGPDYMYDQAARWLIWFKKQSGFDGVRLDAVKHIEYGVVRGLLNELQTNADWASGGEQMFAVGEWIGNAAEMDQWIQEEDHRSGTFDFSIRDGIRQLVSEGGFYDINTLPGTQQNERARIVPVINNHDSFRPERDPQTGQYTNFASGGPFLEAINPTDPRIAVAHAIVMAVDGTPQIAFTDLFDANNGLLYTHDPVDNNQLPVNPQIANIIWAHQVMDWKNFAYRVRTAPTENPDFTGSPIGSSDILVIEREGRALITANDNGSQSGMVWVNCGFPIGTVLHDYSGHFGNVTVTGPDPSIPNGSNRVQLQIPSVNPANNQYGYGIWAKTDFMGMTHSPTQRETIQEWEMSDDLGDSHIKSLGQGGALPAYWQGNPFPNENRYVGQIYAEKGKEIKIEARMEKHSCVTVQVWNEDQTDWAVASGAGAPGKCEGNSEITFKYTPLATGWHTIQIGTITGDAQKAWVKATYTAPQVADVKDDPADNPVKDKLIKEPFVADNGLSFNLYPNPVAREATFNFILLKDANVTLTIYNFMGEPILVLQNGKMRKGENKIVLDAGKNNLSGIYFFKMQTDIGNVSGKFEVKR